MAILRSQYNFYTGWKTVSDHIGCNFNLFQNRSGILAGQT